MIRYIPAVLVGRLVRGIARMRKPGAGAAMPGVVVNRLAPRFLTTTLNSFADGVVVVTGTAGKSTTTRILAALVSAHGKRVFTNPSTANIAQGLTSAIIAESSVTGAIEADIAILEMDEGHAAKLAPAIRPRACVLLNVCVDQVDRFFDPDMVTAMLRTVAQHTSENVVFNRDDANVADVATHHKAGQLSFGMSEVLFERERDDLGYVRSRDLTEHPDDANVVLSAVTGREASVSVDGTGVSVKLPSAGVHYGIDVVAAIAGARAVLGEGFDMNLATETINRIDPVFGRGEIIMVNGHEIECILIQNPASLRLNTRALAPDLDQVMFAVGSDVRDYSYLWSASLTGMPSVTIAAGPQATDVALQCLYNEVAVGDVEPDLLIALDRFIALPAPKHGLKTIIFSADSMRRTRRHLGLAEQGAA